MQSTANIYVNGKFNGVSMAGGELLGKIMVYRDTSLQTLGNTVYQFIQQNRLLNYNSYELKISSESTTTLPPFTNTLLKPEVVEMILPNDLYVPEYGALTVATLRVLLPRSNIGDNIRIDISQFSLGLGKYVK